MERTSNDIEFLKAHVPEFEGYADEIARHHTDQRVRAWVGSRLADVQARLASSLAPDLEAALEQAIFRCQFPDQIFTTRLDVAEVDPQLEESLAQVDGELVELAERASAAQAEDLGAILSRISSAFDRRRKSVPVQPPVG